MNKAEVFRALHHGRGPVNVFARLDGVSAAELGELGATRVTFGPGPQRRATEALRDIAAGLR